MRLLLLAALWGWGCQPAASEHPVPPVSEPAAVVAPHVVQTGAQVLATEDFTRLQGKRVGLIVNHTARVDSLHLIDVLHAAPEVELVALFGPEHGLRGEADAGAEVADGRDARTGLPVYSLYGQHRSPTPEMLAGVEVLVFDIQDIGARFYTYISTMGLAMQAAAQAGIPFVVLDRPNPLGGNQVAGFVREAAYESFVGQFAIPVQHGLTVGELARMVQGEALLPGLEALDLQVVAMHGWQRSMQWPDTGLPWIKPSPNIPDFETALVYPGACFIEATAASEGRGTQTPFLTIGAPWADGEALAATLNRADLPGVVFEATAFTPRSIEGMSSNPKLKDVPVSGIRYVLTDARRFDPLVAGLHLLHALYQQAPPSEKEAFFNERWLNLLAGTPKLYQSLRAGASPNDVVAAWADAVEAFRQQRAPYLLYDG